jgi:hypothetical protein
MSAINGPSYESQILAFLERRPGGWVTADIANCVRPIFGHNARTHSAFVRRKLLDMQKAGTVKPMDNLKPVAWVRAAEGDGLGQKAEGKA